MMRLLRSVMAVTLIGFLAGCEDDDGSPSPQTQPQTQGQEQSSQQSAANNDNGSSPPPASTGGPIDLAQVKWLNTNVSGWEQTASLSVSIGGGTINLNYNKARAWPAVDGLVANPWVFVNVNGVWHAATFEWLKPGQTSKPTATVAGDHIKVAPLNNFRPVSGETYGFMVSGLARTKTRNVKERSNVVMVRWP